MPRSFSFKLRGEIQVPGRLGMSVGKSPRHAQKPLSGEQRKTFSITHHTLSPVFSHHHLYYGTSLLNATAIVLAASRERCLRMRRRSPIYYKEDLQI